MISNNESTKRNVHERHEKHEQILPLFVLFVSFVDSIFALVPKLQLGNLCIPSFSLPYAREAGASKTTFPSWSSHRYTQVRLGQLCRHFGMDAEIQAMDGNV